MGTVYELDASSGGSGVTSYNDLTNKPNYKFTQTLNDSETNVITHNIGSSQEVVDVIVRDSNNEQIPVSNWTVIDVNSINIPITYEVLNAKIYIQTK